MTFRTGDIIAYKPQTLFRRDGIAEVHSAWQDGSPYGKDTFDQRDTRLTPDELATGTVLFNLEDYFESPFIDEAEYADEDVRVLEVRKGIVVRKFRRRGAVALPEEQVAERREQIRAEQFVAARSHLLCPTEDQAYVASPLPEMTEEECTELTDTLAWIGRARSSFDSHLESLARMMRTHSGNLTIQVVHTDESHYELYRARRALDKNLAALRN